MRATRQSLAAVIAILLALAGLSPVTAAADGPTILVFSKTAGFRHDSIPAGFAQLLDRFRATNRLSLGSYTELSVQLKKVRRAEAAGDDARAVRELRQFLSLVTATRVPDADIRAVLNRDARAVIDSIEGAARLPAANTLREARR